MTMPELIRQMRRQTGHSQTSLARKAKVTQSQVSSLENGTTEVGYVSFMRVVEALGGELKFPEHVKHTQVAPERQVMLAEASLKKSLAARARQRDARGGRFTKGDQACE